MKVSGRLGRRLMRPGAYARILGIIGLASSLLPLTSIAESVPTLVTGEVVAEGAQNVIVPAVSENSVVIKFLPPDGSEVKAGDTVLRLDPGPVSAQIVSLRTQLAETIARTEKELADLQIAKLDAALAAIKAQAEYDRAKIDADIPTRFLSEFEASRHRGTFEKANASLIEARQQVETAEAAVTRKRRDVALEAEKVQQQLSFAEAQVARAEVKATKDGVFVTGFNWQGRRFSAGETTYPGYTVGSIVTNQGLSLVAYASEFDRQVFSVGQKVFVRIDATGDDQFEGRIGRISGAPEMRKAWGNARYFTMTIEAEGLTSKPLVPGMSILVSDQSIPNPPTSQAQDSSLVFDGELEALSMQVVSPPLIEQFYRLQITHLLPDGAAVTPGMTVASFGIDQLGDSLSEKVNQRQEKQRQLEKLNLDQAEAARQSEMATNEAESALQKAEKLASQPPETISGVNYAKAVISKREATEALAMTRDKTKLQRSARQAELNQVQSELDRLSADIKALEAGQQSLNVQADRNGVMLHQNNWNGEKITIGSEVGAGQLVAGVGDTSSLLARVAVPEVESNRIKIGDAMTVEVTGSTQRISAKVQSRGRAYRARSGSDANLVLDIVLSLDQSAVGLKPGMPIRAHWQAGAEL